MTRDSFAAQPLTFEVVDGLALAQQRTLLTPEKAAGTWVAADLGPLVELQSLTTQGRIPEWFIRDHLILRTPLAVLAQRIGQRQSFTPLHGSADCGLFQADADADGTVFTGFRLAAWKAAEAAGFPTVSARQLGAAMGELRSNIVEHSNAIQTGYVCFAWRQHRFEFAAVDQGIGVLASLRSSSEFADLDDHGSALGIATTAGKSRYGDGSGHGNGFRDLFLGLMSHSGDLRFRSGDHALELHGSSPEVADATIVQKADMSGFAITVACSPTGEHRPSEGNAA